MRIDWMLRRFDRTTDVQGVRLRMPRSHRLPEYASKYPQYGQNLVHLADRLTHPEPVGIIDVGANIGDSAAQILAKIDARILCIEADPEYLPYLRHNIGSDPRCAIEFGLLTAGPRNTAGMSAIRKGGTTHFTVSGHGGAAAPSLSVSDLPNRHPSLPPVRLIKSDTDGYDTALIPELARTYYQHRPVLFFEYDHGLTRDAGNDPVQIWPELFDLGYRHVGVWDNFGNPLRTCSVESARSWCAVLDDAFARRGYHYWDVAAVHGDDEAGWGAVSSFSPLDA